MRLLFYISAFFLFISSCYKEDKAVNSSMIENGAEITILGQENVKFGNIIEGEKVNIDFRIKNTGKGDLIISNAKASCGCTVAQLPKNLLVPGEEGEIKVTFDSKNRIGEQRKKITLMTNANPHIKILTIEGIILPSEN